MFSLELPALVLWAVWGHLQLRSHQSLLRAEKGPRDFSLSRGPLGVCSSQTILGSGESHNPNNLPFEAWAYALSNLQSPRMNSVTPFILPRLAGHYRFCIFCSSKHSLDNFINIDWGNVYRISRDWAIDQKGKCWTVLGSALKVAQLVRKMVHSESEFILSDSFIMLPSSSKLGGQTGYLRSISRELYFRCLGMEMNLRRLAVGATPVSPPHWSCLEHWSRPRDLPELSDYNRAPLWYFWCKF